MIASRLEHFGYHYRKLSKEKSGGNKDLEAKTQVRFGNRAHELVLGIRKTKDAEWEFYYQNLPKLDDSESMEGLVIADDDDE